MTIKQKDVKKYGAKYAKATREELEKVEAAYMAATAELQAMPNAMLILLCIVGVAIILGFSSSIFDFVGLLVFSYAFYVFAEREGRRDGYIESHFSDGMDKKGKE